MDVKRNYGDGPKLVFEPLPSCNKLARVMSDTGK